MDGREEEEGFLAFSPVGRTEGPSPSFHAIGATWSDCRWRRSSLLLANFL